MTDKPKKRRKAPPRIAFDAPPHLIAQIKTRALRERTTVRLMMLDALKAYGFNIPDDELIHDRRLLNPGRPSKAA